MTSKTDLALGAFGTATGIAGISIGSTALSYAMENKSRLNDIEKGNIPINLGSTITDDLDLSASSFQLTDETGQKLKQLTSSSGKGITVTDTNIQLTMVSAESNGTAGSIPMFDSKDHLSFSEIKVDAKDNRSLQNITRINDVDFTTLTPRLNDFLSKSQGGDVTGTLKIKNIATDTSLLTGRDNSNVKITDGSLEIFATNNIELTSDFVNINSNIVTSGNIETSDDKKNNIGSAAKKFNTIYSDIFDGLSLPTEASHACNKAYVDDINTTLSSADLVLENKTQNMTTDEIKTNFSGQLYAANIVTSGNIETSDDKKNNIGSDAKKFNIIYSDIFDGLSLPTEASHACNKAYVDDINTTLSSADLVLEKKTQNMTTALEKTTISGKIEINSSDVIQSKIARLGDYKVQLPRTKTSSTADESNMIFSQYSSNYAAFRAFDGIYGNVTKDEAYFGFIAQNNGNNAFLIIDDSKVIGEHVAIDLSTQNSIAVVTSFQLFCLQEFAFNFPTEFYIIGSNTGVSWTTLFHTNSSESTIDGDYAYSEEISIPNATPYKYVGVLLIGETQVQELILHGIEVESSSFKINDHLIKEENGNLIANHPSGGSVILSRPKINPYASYSNSHIDYSDLNIYDMLAENLDTFGGQNRCWGNTETYIAGEKLRAGRAVGLVSDANTGFFTVGYLLIGSLDSPSVYPMGITQHNAEQGEKILICTKGYTSAFTFTSNPSARWGSAVFIKGNAGQISLTEEPNAARIGCFAQHRNVGSNRPCMIYVSGEFSA